MDRMLKRQRSEETGVTLDYLTGIHQKHEDWLLTNNDGRGGMAAGLGSPLSASAWTHQGQSLPAALQAQLGSNQAGILKLQAVEEPPEIQGKVSRILFWQGSDDVSVKVPLISVLLHNHGNSTIHLLTQRQ